LLQKSRKEHGVYFIRTIFPQIIFDQVGKGACRLVVARCIDLTASASAILITKLAAELLISFPGGSRSAVPREAWWFLLCWKRKPGGAFLLLWMRIFWFWIGRGEGEGRGVRSQGQGGERNQVEPIEVASSLSAIRERGDLAMAHTSGLPGGNEDPPEWLTMPPNEAWFKAKQGDKDAQFIMGKG